MTPPARRRLEDALHLGVLAGFAVAQPLYDLLGRNADFFVAHGARPPDLLAFCAGASVGIPALLVLLETAAGAAGERLRRAAHALLVGGLLALLGLVAVRDAGDLALPLATAAGLLAGGAAVAGRPLARGIFTVLAPSIVLFPVLFLGATPVARLLVPVEPIRHTIAPRSDAPVVLVVFDEFPVTSLMRPDGTLDRERYPGFAALAAEGLWFRNATTVATNTTQAVPAILTGIRPEGGKLATASDHPDSLFTLLGGTYSLDVHEPLTRVCPPSLCEDETALPFPKRMAAIGRDAAIAYLHLVTPLPWAARLPPIDAQWTGFGRPGARADRVDPAQGIRLGGFRSDRRGELDAFISGLDTKPRRSFHFFHTLLPHRPWIYLPSGSSYLLDGASTAADRGKWAADSFAAVEAQQRHLLQVAFLDEVVGALRATKRYEEALVIVTADHGIGFRPDRLLRGISSSGAGDILRVPLFVKLPGSGPRGVVDRPVETIDVVPTIADVLGIAIPWTLDGESLLRGGGSGVDRRRSVRDVHELVEIEEATTSLTTPLERQASLFGAGSRRRIFTAGPQGRLFGEGVAGLPVEPAPEVTVLLDDPLVYEDLRDGGFVPSYVRGRIEGVTGRVAIGVAVNGTVRAFTIAEPETAEAARFAALVPESAFRKGANDVGILLLDEGDPGRVRRPAMIEKGGYELADGGIQRPDGTVRAVGGGYALGRVGKVESHGALIVLAGWALDPESRAPVGRIVLFRGRRSLQAVAPRIERPDVARRLGLAGAGDLGFRIVLPRHRIADAREREIRVFAISNSGASELLLPPGWLEHSGSDRVD